MGAKEAGPVNLWQECWTRLTFMSPVLHTEGCWTSLHGSGTEVPLQESHSKLGGGGR